MESECHISVLLNVQYAISSKFLKIMLQDTKHLPTQIFFLKQGMHNVIYVWVNYVSIRLSSNYEYSKYKIISSLFERKLFFHLTILMICIAFRFL